jgi:ribosome biogenesis protein ERB1
MKIVRAIRQGKIVRKPPPKPRAQIASYDIWSSDPPTTQQDIKIPTTQRIPAPKLKLPEHDESYNPPAEYVATEQERKEWEELEEEDREKNYLSKKHGSLRLVPAWAEFVKEQFERCLDLYLAPRVQKNRLNIDPDSLIPKLPSPKDLRPFPSRIGVVYEGHTDRIRAISIDPTGLWVTTGSDDGSVRVWECGTGREVWKWMYPHHGQDEVVYAMSWNPVKEIGLLTVAVGDTVYVLVPPIWSVKKMENTREVCEKGFHAEGTNKNEISGVKWSRGKNDDIALIVKTWNTVRCLTWHRRGDYFATVAPQGNFPSRHFSTPLNNLGTSGKSVLIHQLSRHQTQSPFSRLKGSSIQSLVFHPIFPQIFVASRQSITHYSLTPPQLIRKLRPGVKYISSLDVHPRGNHLIVGSYDKRVAWFDLDLSDRPYKTLRFAERAVRDVAFHKGGIKCFASASDEGVVQVFWADVRTDGSVDVNPTIVPLKVLKGHRVMDSLGTNLCFCGCADSRCFGS